MYLSSVVDAATSTLPDLSTQYLPTEAVSSIASRLNHFEWKDENGVKHELRIYSDISHKWREIAELLGFHPGQIESLQDEYRRNGDRVRHVLGRWFEDAVNLPHHDPNKYPLSWDGLLSILHDAQLGEVKKVLRKALSLSSSKIK